MDSFDSLKYLPLYGVRGDELDFLRIVICGNYKSMNFIMDLALAIYDFTHFSILCYVTFHPIYLYGFCLVVLVA